MKRIGVIGGGAWGTALATVAASAGRTVTLWAREPDVLAAINDHHENRRFLPGVPLDPAIRATDNLSEAADADLLLLVTPAQNLAAVTQELVGAAEHLPPCVVCAKGIERRTGSLMSDAVRRVAPGLPLAALSGPTFAREVAKGLPAAVSLACEDERLGRAVVDALGAPAFRPYLTDDLIGVQIGGAVKNVIAIAAGIAIGRGLGENARAAIIARGFAELTRLAAAKGARPETLAGLSGLGDLVLTCTSDKSRNFSFGRALGAGAEPGAVLGAREAVTEGATSAPAVMTMASNLGVEMPIAGAVHAVLHRGASIEDAVGGLLARPFKPEAGAGRRGRS
ncbi:MAG: NAD(P)-dependent glycerol-3-phosphate dehydrogenase [Rhodospirillaceae bacterium]|nr:NAD(P)-dependent glycerol-3-phosphate dehydrogenase [Rhodospirillaceae bacterium]